MKSKKMAIIGVTAGLVAGAGAGFVLNLPGGASAEKRESAINVQATGDDSGSASGMPGNSIGGDMMGDGDHDGDHGMGMMDDGDREQHLRDALQSLVDDGTLTAADVDAVVTALSTKPATPPAPPADGSEPDHAAMMKNRLQSLVDDGTLSSSQLDKIVAALDAAMPAGGRGHMGGGRDGHMGGRHGGRGGMMGGQLLETAASTIGITADELKAELKSGKTVAEVAVANGKTAKQVIDALVADASDELEQRITDFVNGTQPAAPTTPATTAP